MAYEMYDLYDPLELTSSGGSPGLGYAEVKDGIIVSTTAGTGTGGVDYSWAKGSGSYAITPPPHRHTPPTSTSHTVYPECDLSPSSHSVLFLIMASLAHSIRDGKSDMELAKEYAQYFKVLVRLLREEETRNI
jgi:hypothetical protein